MAFYNLTWHYITLLDWGNSLCAIKKDSNALWAPGKIQRSSLSLLQLFCALHATAVSLDSNAVKLQVWKVKNTLKCKYVINFFEHLNDFKWKNSKLENYRSRRDLQLSSFKFFHLKSLRYSKKINDIFRLKSIFVFSHLQLTALEPKLTAVV